MNEPIKSDRPSQRTLLPLEQRFAAYGDDSSDEEREEAVYNTPITVRKHPGSPITKSHHKTTPLTPEHAQKVEEAIDKLKSLPIIKQSKLSRDKRLITKAKKGLQELSESPIKSLIQTLYDKSIAKGAKKQTIDKFKYSLQQEILSWPEYETVHEQPTHLDLNVSSIIQNLGIRLLSSNKVRELYFPNKPTKLGTFTNLPTDERITTLLENTLRTALQHLNLEDKLDLVLESEAYQNLTKEALADKQSVLNGTKLQTPIQNLVHYLLEQQDPVRATRPKEIVHNRQIQLLITRLEQIPNFVTSKQKVCVSKAFKAGIIKALHTENGDQKYKNCIEEAYNKLTPNQSVQTLLDRSKEIFLDKTLNDQAASAEKKAQDLTDNFKKKLGLEITKLKAEFVRPTLPDSTSFSATDLSLEAYHGAETLLSYIRLIHCSAKRYLKNSKSDSDFDGATFGRGWSFDNTKNLAIIEQQDVSPNGLNSMVQYPYDSNYSALAYKLNTFQTKYNFKNHQVVSEIKSILKTGHLSEGITLSESFTRFLFTLTYHLFGTEVERHPAAAIHNIMALDLSNNDGINTDWLTKLPMSIKKALEVVRAIQTTLMEIESLDIPYYYDHNDSSYGPDNAQFQDFVRMEKDLVYNWLVNKELSTNLNSEESLSALDNLCKEYYDISINVMGSTEHHGGEI